MNILRLIIFTVFLLFYVFQQNLLLNFHEDDIPARLLEFLGIPDYYQQQYEIGNK